MKNILPFLLSLLVVFTTEAQEGINFIKQDWKAALAQAEATGKPIFLDAYTSWCAPCKKMDKIVFKEKVVADFYNENFVNIKMDMEKGEGKTLAKQFGIKAYPTFLFIGADGKDFHRGAGYLDQAAFIELGKIAINPDNNIAALQKKFEAGEQSPAFLKQYMSLRYDLADGSHAAVFDRYLDTQSDFTTDENLKMVFLYVANTDSKAFDVLLENKSAFIEKYGATTVRKKIGDLVISKLSYTDPDPTLEEREALFNKVYTDKAAMMFAIHKMSYYRERGDRKGFAQAAVNRYENYPCEDFMELNDVAFTFYKVVEEEEMLKKAVKWAKKSIKMEKSNQNYDTLAALYKKIGKKRKAKRYAKKAIKWAKKNDEDHLQHQNLLDQILKMD